MNRIQGIHHITCMTANPQQNLDFYTKVLGQRFVKRTVNFDDPGTYHFYYGDNVGSPGTIMTFFPWAHIAKGRRGNGETLATAYAIRPDSVRWWQEWLNDQKIEHVIETRFGESVLVFSDPEDMVIELVAHVDEPVPEHWENGPIPAEHALQAFHGVTLGVHDATPTAALLTGSFGYELVGQEGNRVRYQGAGGYGQFVDLLVRLGHARGRLGAGSVHHVAFRTVDDSEQLEYLEALRQAGHPATSVKDRQYFHSIYFREPNGTLFEVATDAPGFLYDEPVESLGSELKLPSWLEQHRDKIETMVPPIHLDSYA
ncbi:MAG: ring-cleaving dioxygenase [Anaerolineae bacterium]